MKFLYLITFTFIAFAQNGYTKIESVNNEELVEFVRTMKVISSEWSSELGVRIISTDNTPASAGMANSEITRNLYILTIEEDMVPEVHMFKVGEFYSAKVRTIKKSRFEHHIEISFIRDGFAQKILLAAKLGSLKLL